MKQTISIALRVTLVTLVVTGLLYPILVTALRWHRAQPF